MGKGLWFILRIQQSQLPFLDNFCDSPASTTDLQMLPARRYIWFEERYAINFASSRWARRCSYECGMDRPTQ